MLIQQFKVSEVTKLQAQNTRHRYRLFARLEQSDDPYEDSGDVKFDPEEYGPDGKRIKLENENRLEKDSENPDEIEIDDSDEDEPKPDIKPKPENKDEPEEEEEEEYDPCMDPNLDDLDPAEYQDARRDMNPEGY